jgi:putative SOS response-associated peptidase YedK
VPAGAFYEWQKLDAKYAAVCIRHEERRAVGIRGAAERWMAPYGKPLDSFAIITTDPNEVTAKVHARIPVIVEPRDRLAGLRVQMKHGRLSTCYGLTMLQE